MRKLTALLIIFTTAFAFVACDDEATAPIPVDETGNIFVESTPAGAEIWLDGTNTGKVTPDSLTDLDEGTYDVTLKLENYSDTTVSIIVTADQTASKTVTLTSDLFLSSFGPVRIYETAGTGVNQPSGLDLSSGMAYGISGADNNKVDIYYSTDGTSGETYLVQSADLSPSMTRVTKFRVGNSTNLDDNTDSPLQSSGTWTNYMDDRETNYVFLYDNDGHYSKAKIVDFGGGIFDPAWVEIMWYYNNTSDDTRF